MTCSKCDTYKKEAEKYKYKYKTVKSGLTDNERSILIELICDKQLTHIVHENGYESESYKSLEELKAKIRII